MCFNYDCLYTRKPAAFSIEVSWGPARHGLVSLSKPQKNTPQCRVSCSSCTLLAGASAAVCPQGLKPLAAVASPLSCAQQDPRETALCTHVDCQSPHKAATAGVCSGELCSPSPGFDCCRVKRWSAGAARAELLVGLRRALVSVQRAACGSLKNPPAADRGPCSGVQTLRHRRGLRLTSAIALCSAPLRRGLSAAFGH